MSFGHDDELPGGFQDADFEMRDLQAAAGRSRRARARGLCDHTWTGPVTVGEAPRQCYHCKRVFPNQTALDKDRANNIETMEEA